MVATKRLDASRFDEVRDATFVLEVKVTLQHCHQSKPGDPERCALVTAAKEQGHFDKFIVHRSVAYGRRSGETGWLRWQSSSSTRKFVEKFDKGDYTDIGADGLVFTFRPPRRSLSLDFLRKRKLVAIKKAKRRPYRLPDPKTLEGVRNRFGYH